MMSDFMCHRGENLPLCATVTHISHVVRYIYAYPDDKNGVVPTRKANHDTHMEKKDFALEKSFHLCFCEDKVNQQQNGMHVVHIKNASVQGNAAKYTKHTKSSIETVKAAAGL